MLKRFLCKDTPNLPETSEKNTLTAYMQEKYAKREDKDDIYAIGLTDAEFRTFIIDYLLGPDWYVADPMGQTQVNEVALYQILEKFSERYRKEKQL